MNPSLEQLRDIHLPDGVSLWPLAPGWWWLLALAIGVVGAAFVWRRWHFKTRAKRLALRELRRLEQRFRHNGDSAELCRALSRLLRRYCLVEFAHLHPAGLQGQAWVTFLQRHGPQATGETLAQLESAPYQSEPQVNVEALLSTTRYWLRKAR